MKNKNWNEEPGYDLRWLVVGLIVALVWAISSKPSVAWVETTSDYHFSAAEDITMDVTMVNGTSGTYQCPSAQSCYIKALKYEARGAQQYCVSLVMKRNGKVIWHRRYR